MSDKQKALNRGHATKAGQLLSKWLRQIAEEETEFIKDNDGEDRMVTKAEAIARLIWKKALGYSKTEIIKGEKIITHYPPDRAMINMLLDRIEGRAPMSTDMGKKKRSIADKVSEQGTKRITNAGSKTESKT